MKTSRRAFNSAAFTGAMLLAAPALAQGREKFIYGVPGPITSGVANITFAEELGYYAAERMEVDMVPLAGSAVIIPQILSGQIQGSGASLDPVIVSRDPGKPNFAVKFVYNINRNMVWEFAVMPSSPVTKIGDLTEGVIGVSSLAANNIPHQAMLRASGVDLSKIKFQAVGVGMQAYEALRTNQVQALGLWDVTHTAIEANAAPLRRLPLPPEFLGRSSHGLEVSNQELDRRPEFFARFGRAFAKGTLAATANPEGALRSFWKRYPGLKPKTGTESEIVERELRVMMARLNNQAFFAPGAKRQWGAFSEEDWLMLIRLLKEGGAIQNDKIPLESLYTNALVPEFNKFNSDEVVRQARAYK